MDTLEPMYLSCLFNRSQGFCRDAAPRASFTVGRCSCALRTAAGMAQQHGHGVVLQQCVRTGVPCRPRLGELMSQCTPPMSMPQHCPCALSLSLQWHRARGSVGPYSLLPSSMMP